ncbi:MAG: DUF805 domain-containing protein [Hyphomonadaceae bacterium]
MVSLLFGFSGRINRVQFWLGSVIGGVGGAVLLFLLALLTMPAAPFPKTPEASAQFIPSLSFALGLPLLLMSWIGSALQTKRFHDRGRSGLFALLPMLPLIMIVAAVISGAATGASLEQVVSSATLWFFLLQLINLFMFVDLGCMPGKAEANRYGPPPGGGFTSGAPVGGPSFQGKTAPAKPQTGAPGMAATTFSGAESAIDRAIAARAKQAQTEQSASAAAKAGSGLQPTPSGSFGRRAAR